MSSSDGFPLQTHPLTGGNTTQSEARKWPNPGCNLYLFLGGDQGWAKHVLPTGFFVWTTFALQGWQKHLSPNLVADKRPSLFGPRVFSIGIRWQQPDPGPFHREPQGEL